MSVISDLLIKHDIVLCHGRNGHIVRTLVWNFVLFMKLKLFKVLHGIHRPTVHLYALCWNEEKMLPFMFQHYEPFVDEFIIYDNYSDDQSERIINTHPNAVLKKFSMGGQINDYVYQEIKNNCWKKSRSKADFVIVCDTDELLYNNNILNMLMTLKSQRFSIVKPFGYNMYSMDYPNFAPDHPITDQVRRGVREPMFDKCILFDPHAIVEMNYKPGAHECHPWGRVKWYRDEDVKLLHYKNIGLEQLIERNRLYASRLSKENIENNYGAEYLKNEQLIIREFKDYERCATDII